MNLEIVPASSSDSEAVVQLIQEMASGFTCHSPITKEYVDSYLEKTSSRVLLGKLREETVALLSYSVRPCLFHAGDAWYIEEVIVTAQYRGKGISRLLLENVLERAYEKGCVEISIAVGAENDRARHVYEKSGFEECALLMEKHFVVGKRNFE